MDLRTNGPELTKCCIDVQLPFKQTDLVFQLLLDCQLPACRASESNAVVLRLSYSPQQALAWTADHTGHAPFDRAVAHRPLPNLSSCWLPCYRTLTVVWAPSTQS